MADKRLPLLMLAAAGLGALLWWDMQPESETPDVVAAAGPASEGRGLDGQAPASATPERVSGGETVNPLASLDKESLRDMTERPMFTPSRRPPSAPVTPAIEPAFTPPPAPPPTPDFTLLGIIRDGDRAIALLRSRSDGRNLRVEGGDMIGGWEIAAVGAASVRLKRGDGAAHELRLPPR
jgi:hypothetical protein